MKMIQCPRHDSCKAQNVKKIKKCPHLSKHLTKRGGYTMRENREAVGRTKRRNPGRQGQCYNPVDKSTLSDLQ